MDEAEWLPMDRPGMPPIGGKRIVETLSDDPDQAAAEIDFDICPGVYVRQPAVAQAAEAQAAFDKGELTTYFPRTPNAILEGAMLMESARGEFTNWKMNEKK